MVFPSSFCRLGNGFVDWGAGASVRGVVEALKRQNVKTSSPPYAFFSGSAFFQVRFGALMIKPFLIAAVETRTYRTSPFTSALTRWRLGKNRRLVIAVICVPISPLFFGLPLCPIMLRFIRRLPVYS